MHSILLIHDSSEIVHHFLQYLQKYQDTVKIFIASPLTPSSNILPHIHIPIEPSQLKSWQNYLENETYTKDPFLRNVQTIIIFPPATITSDITTSQILSILQSIIRDSKIFAQPPKIYCEIYDETIQPILQKHIHHTWQRTIVCGEMYAYSLLSQYCKKIALPRMITQVCIKPNWFSLPPIGIFAFGIFVGIATFWGLQKIFTG